MTRAIAIFCALLLLLLAAGTPGLADETDTETAARCPKERVVGAACPLPAQVRRQARTPRAEGLQAREPLTRDATSLRTVSTVRGAQKPGRRL